MAITVPAREHDRNPSLRGGRRTTAGAQAAANEGNTAILHKAFRKQKMMGMYIYIYVYVYVYIYTYIMYYICLFSQPTAR